MKSTMPASAAVQTMIVTFARQRSVIRIELGVPAENMEEVTIPLRRY